MEKRNIMEKKKSMHVNCCENDIAENDIFGNKQLNE